MGILGTVGRAIGLATRADLDRLASDNRVLEARLRMSKARVNELRSEASGVAITWGKYEYEQNERLRGPERWEVFEEMESDPHVEGALAFNAMPLVSARWEIKAASDKARDKEVAEFVAANLLCQGGEQYGREYWTETSWEGQRLDEILSMLQYGFAMFHKSWRVVGSKRVYDRLTWLEPASVDPRGWDLADGTDDLLRVRRTFRLPSGQLRFLAPIDAKDLALYVWGIRGARYPGRPLTRAMFGAWYRKKFMLEQRAIRAQKVGSPIPYMVFPADFEPKEVEDAYVMAQSARGTSSAEAWGAFRYGRDGQEPILKYAGIDAGAVDPLAGSITDENSEIAAGGNRTSARAASGDAAHGSRAAAETSASFERTFIRGIVRKIAGMELRGVANVAGLISELADTNFSGVRNMPELVASEIFPDEAPARAKDIGQAVKDGLLPAPPELKRQVAEMYELHLPDDAFDEPPPPAPPAAIPGAAAPGAQAGQKGVVAAPTNGEAGPPAAAKPNGKQVSAAALALRDEVARLRGLPEGSGVIDRSTVDGGRGEKPRGMFRPPTEFEHRYVALGAIDRELTVSADRWFAVASGVVQKMKADLVARFRDGRIGQQNYQNLRRGDDGPNVKYRAQLRDGLLKVLRSVSAFGAAQVRDELARQRADHAAGDGAAAVGLALGARAMPDPAAWETARPWDEPAARFESGDVAGFALDPRLVAATATRGGEIVVGPRFFGLSARERRRAVYRALGLGLAARMFADGTAARLVRGGHMPGGAAARARTALDHLNGYTVPREVIAEAYAALQDDPTFLVRAFPDLSATVRAAAEGAGFPLVAAASAVLAWDEAAHPREPSGTSEGGEFSPAGGGSASETSVGLVPPHPGVPGFVVEYHGTAAENIPSILRDGLTPHVSDLNPGKPSAVYMTDDYNEASAYAFARADRAAGEWDKVEPVVLEIYVPEVDRSSFVRVPESSVSAWRTEHGVPAAWIRAMYELTPGTATWHRRILVAAAGSGVPGVFYVVALFDVVKPGATLVFDESRHPRHPGGTAEGGEFAPAGGGGAATASTTQALPGLPDVLRAELDAVDREYPSVDPAGVETIARHADRDGRWSAERAALHARLMAEYLRDAPGAEGRPVFTMFGGGSAAGKSELRRLGVLDIPDGSLTLDSDDVKRRLPEYDAMVRHRDGRAAAYVHEESSAVTKRLMAEGFAAGKNVVLDGTGDASYAGLRAKVDAARAAGYEVRAEYATCDTEEAVRRNVARAARSGRLIPETFLRDVHASVSKIFPRALADGLFDRARLWDMTDRAKPKLVVTARGNRYEVHDPALWARFLAKAGA